nr:MAG TPA: hypothetical protein [Caudoviricetes sp.]
MICRITLKSYLPSSQQRLPCRHLCHIYRLTNRFGNKNNRLVKN